MNYGITMMKVGSCLCLNIILKDNILTERAEGRAEGRAAGRVEGRAEGRAEEKRETARNMKALNIPINTISQITGLSAEEIQGL